MFSNNNIEHKGIIENIDENYIYVKIQAHSACSACHAKGMCSASDMKEKIIEVKRHLPDTFKIKEEVTVTLNESLGFSALILGYLIPFILFISILVVCTYTFSNELIAGLSSVGILIPYYLILYLKRNSLKNKFEFKIHKN